MKGLIWTCCRSGIDPLYLGFRGPTKEPAESKLCPITGWEPECICTYLSLLTVRCWGFV